MLTIHTPSTDYFDDATQEFITIEPVTLQLEHSLISLSKWESIWEKPFLGPTPKTDEEARSYVECMVVSSPVDSPIYSRLSEANVDAINEYISSRPTATTVNESKTTGGSRETITSELIYYWMFASTIPIDCQEWHIERLFALIKVFNAKNAPKKKTAPGTLAAQRREMNAQRRAQSGSSG